LGSRVPDPRGESVVLRPVCVRSPRLRLDAARRRALPARSGVQAALLGLQHRLRARLRRRRGHALQLTGRVADLRSLRPERGGTAPMKRVTIVLLVALAFPSAAWAHATLEKTAPRIGQRLSASPTVITLTFDQSVRVLSNGIQVFDAKGRIVSGPPRVSASDRRMVQAPVRRLP